MTPNLNAPHFAGSYEDPAATAAWEAGKSEPTARPREVNGGPASPEVTAEWEAAKVATPRLDVMA